jgi:hypothetical protein
VHAARRGAVTPRRWWCSASSHSPARTCEGARTANAENDAGPVRVAGLDDRPQRRGDRGRGVERPGPRLPAGAQMVGEGTAPGSHARTWSAACWGHCTHRRRCYSGCPTSPAGCCWRGGQPIPAAARSELGALLAPAKGAQVPGPSGSPERGSGSCHPNRSATSRRSRWWWSRWTPTPNSRTAGGGTPRCSDDYASTSAPPTSSCPKARPAPAIHARGHERLQDHDSDPQSYIVDMRRTLQVAREHELASCADASVHIGTIRFG